MSVSQKSLFTLFSLLMGVAALMLACSSSDAPSPGSSGSSGASSSSGSAGASGSSSGDDAGIGSGGTEERKIGEPCEVGTNCESGTCFKGGTGGGTGSTQGVCTITCTMPGQENDPTCTDPALTGKCNGKGFCQVK